jgi:hypothetical protein
MENFMLPEMLKVGRSITPVCADKIARHHFKFKDDSFFINQHHHVNGYHGLNSSVEFKNKIIFNFCRENFGTEFGSFYYKRLGQLRFKVTNPNASWIWRAKIIAGTRFEGPQFRREDELTFLIIGFDKSELEHA